MADGSPPRLQQRGVFDEYHVVEARAAGASSLTLVAELVDANTLGNLISATQRNRMTAIVRVQNRDELHATLEVCPPVIELGKRDPASGTLDLGHLEALRAEIPSTCRVLFYNRLRTLDEAKAVAALKPNAVLISPHLLAEANAVPQLREIFAN